MTDLTQTDLTLTDVEQNADAQSADMQNADAQSATKPKQRKSAEEINLKHYIAFLSHRSIDHAVALKLQKNLEHYRIGGKARSTESSASILSPSASTSPNSPRTSFPRK